MPYLFDIIPKKNKGKDQYVFNSGDPKVYSCVLISVKSCSQPEDAAIACLANKSKSIQIDKLYIARVFRRSRKLVDSILRGLSRHVF